MGVRMDHPVTERRQGQQHGSTGTSFSGNPHYNERMAAFRVQTWSKAGNGINILAS